MESQNPARNLQGFTTDAPAKLSDTNMPHGARALNSAFVTRLDFQLHDRCSNTYRYLFLHKKSGAVSEIAAQGEAISLAPKYL